MRNSIVCLAIGVLVVALPIAAGAQDSVLVLETAFEGDLSESVQTRFRGGLHEELTNASARTIVTEDETRRALGEQADRLMSCFETECLQELGTAADASHAVAANINESGQFYTYTIDVFDLATGENSWFGESDCALCTLDEAIQSFNNLARDAGVVLTAQGPVASGTDLTLFIEAQPNDATIYVNGELRGEGEAEVPVTAGATHVIRVELEGYVTIERELDIEEGDEEDKLITVRLTEADEEGPVARRGGGAFDNFDTTTVGSVLLGTGLVAAITGVVLLAMDGDTTCSDGEIQDCPNVFNTTAGGIALTVGGTATATTGLFMLLWESLAGPPATTSSDSTAMGVGFAPTGGTVFFSTDF